MHAHYWSCGNWYSVLELYPVIYSTALGKTLDILSIRSAEMPSAPQERHCCEQTGTCPDGMRCWKLRTETQAPCWVAGEQTDMACGKSTAGTGSRQFQKWQLGMVTTPHENTAYLDLKTVKKVLCLQNITYSACLNRNIEAQKKTGTCQIQVLNKKVLPSSGQEDSVPVTGD